MIRPTLEELRPLCDGNTILPVAMEMFADVKTSTEILRSIKEKYSRFYILESVESRESWGRYSFLGYDPRLTVSGCDGRITVRNGILKETPQGDPVKTLKEMMAAYKSPRISYLPPFTGGFVGYFSYEFIRYIEPTLQMNSENPEGFDDFCLMLFDKVIAVDHFRQKIFLIVNIKPENLEENYIQAVSDLKDMERQILTAGAAEAQPSGLLSDLVPARTEADYCGMVERAKEYIREGDIFQVVSSNRFTADFEGDLFQTYRILRTTNPSPYMVYLSCGDLQIASASPETLVTLRDGVVSTYPLAGTCPRGSDDETDRKLIEALLADEKELAEHDMLVDLGRNDLGKVCTFGTVQVEEYRTVRKFSRVCHIASKVTGRLAPQFGAFDAMAATLPAGTLSGAPKKRACEIIDELEGQKRGPYGGAMGYIDFAGNMDLCIGIRMAVLKDGRVHVQAGGGVVADSDPASEYRESCNKAGAVMDALRQAREV